MDKLTLEWTVEKLKYKQLSSPRLSIFVNDISLCDVVSNFERSNHLTAFDDAFLKESDVLEYSLASWIKSTTEGEVRITLLGCDCGQVECSNVYATACNRDGWVYWQFGGWPRTEYSAMPTFWFNAEQYTLAVGSAFTKYATSTR